MAPVKASISFYIVHVSCVSYNVIAKFIITCYLTTKRVVKMHVIKSCAQPVPEVKKSGRIIADIFY